MTKRFLAAMTLALAVGSTACVAGEARTTSPGSDYKKVSDLVALPAFIPGLGTLYVKPSTLPAGPFLAYDRGNRLVSTIYMVPLNDLQAHKTFEKLAVGAAEVKTVSLHYNAGHPGVESPHYHIVLWHVAPESAKLK